MAVARQGMAGLGGFVLGLVAGAVIVGAGAALAAAVFGISQMEGAYAMGVVFVYMPIGALAGGIAGAAWAAKRARRRRGEA